MNSDTLCPCISGLEYKNCCAPLHKGEITAHNAEQLMRAHAIVPLSWKMLITLSQPCILINVNLMMKLY